jgi:hypothetical protein
MTKNNSYLRDPDSIVQSTLTHFAFTPPGFSSSDILRWRFENPQNCEPGNGGKGKG